MWVMGQTWESLLFAHWRLQPERLQRLVPGLPVDTFGGDAWLGITPFVVTGLRVVGTPPVPGLSRFPELNVRTYVTLEDKPGIYFFSLDGGIFRAEIHHPPWPLQTAEAELETNTMAPAGLELPGDPLLHFAERQDVVVWPLERANAP
jgi:uncharacterized protein YqjF (DUF2071 family)